MEEKDFFVRGAYTPDTSLEDLLVGSSKFLFGTFSCDVNYCAACAASKEDYAKLLRSKLDSRVLKALGYYSYGFYAPKSKYVDSSKVQVDAIISRYFKSDSSFKDHVFFIDDHDFSKVVYGVKSPFDDGVCFKRESKLEFLPYTPKKVVDMDVEETDFGDFD